MGFYNGKPSKNFTGIPNSLIRDNNLTDSTFKLICWVASHDNNFNINFAVIEKYLGYKRDKIRSAIKNAEQNDYLVRIREHNQNNGKFGWQYYIFTSKEDTQFFREKHLSTGESSIGGSSTGGVSVGGSPVDGSGADELSNGGLPIGGSSIGGLSNGGSSTPHIKEQLEEKQLEKKHTQKAPPLPVAPPTHECVCETDSKTLFNQEEELIPESSSLLNKPGSSFQTDIPSCEPTMARLFDKNEQTNSEPHKQKFQSIEDLLNQVLLDPGIMASDPLPAVYRSEIKLRGWRFPWRTPTRDKIYQTCDRALVELIARERASWSGCSWLEKIPTVIKSIGNLEASKGGLEELLGYWSKVLESTAPQTSESVSKLEPVGYYSNRSVDWHKATFCELLDLSDRVGTDSAINQFSTRYDQQHSGATIQWLEWLKVEHPSMYVHLHPQAA